MAGGHHQHLVKGGVRLGGRLQEGDGNREVQAAGDGLERGADVERRRAVQTRRVQPLMSSDGPKLFEFIR